MWGFDIISLNEVSFYNTNGDEISISNIVNQMINYYNLKHEVGETVVTDFNEGSEIRNLLEAFAIGIYALLEEQHEATRIAFIESSDGGWLDKIGELPFIDLARDEGSEASGVVTFTVGSVQESDVFIPAGTMVQDSSNEIDFTTSVDATIIAGEESVSVVVEAVGVGSDGNVPAGNIDTIVDTDIDTELLSVTNPEALMGGSDFEDDDDYRARLLANVQADGFGSQGWYRSLCEDVDGVHDVKLVDDSDYTKMVLVNGSVKPTPDSVLLDVLGELTVLDNLVVGHSFMVDTPSYTSVDLDISLDVVSEVNEDNLLSVLTVLFDGGDASVPISYTGLNIGESLRRGSIEGALSVFEIVVGVTSITCDGVEVDVLEPETVNSVLQLGTVSFTQNVVE